MSEQNQNYIIHPLMIKIFLYFFLRFSVLSLLPQQDFVVEFVSLGNFYARMGYS